MTLDALLVEVHNLAELVEEIAKRLSAEQALAIDYQPIADKVKAISEYLAKLIMQRK